MKEEMILVVRRELLERLGMFQGLCFEVDRYLPALVKDNLPRQIIVLTGYAWAGLMFVLGLANLYVAANYSPIVWGYFLSIGATGAKIVAFFIQYAVFQILVRRHLRTQPRLLPGTTAGMQTSG